MNSIREQIDNIGAELVCDTFAYPDVVCDPVQGIIPRCLIYEDWQRDENARGAVVVGINPGRSTPHERAFYCQRGCTYSNVKEYWREHVCDHPYYKQLREFLDQADMSGPILWTELVKCESAGGVTSLSVQTVRDSIDRYLVREIACVPENWPLIGVGAKAFEILAYRFPRRLVIGLPHPTGARGGQFYRLMPAGKIDARAKTRLDALLNGGNPIASPFQCIGDDCQFR